MPFKYYYKHYYSTMYLFAKNEIPLLLFNCAPARLPGETSELSGDGDCVLFISQYP